MRRIRLDYYRTARGEFEVAYDPGPDLVVQLGRDDLGHAFEEQAPAAEFVQDMKEEDAYLADLVESLRQNRPEIMVQWGIAVSDWEQARRRRDVSTLRAHPAPDA